MPYVFSPFVLVKVVSVKRWGLLVIMLTLRFSANHHVCTAGIQEAIERRVG
jgi:hypothetical protein